MQTSSKPQFVRTLKDKEVEEGDSLTISCKRNDQRQPPLTRPQFVQTLKDQEVKEGDRVTLACKNSSTDSPTPSRPQFVQMLKDTEVDEGDNLIVSCKNSAPLESLKLPPPTFIKGTISCDHQYPSNDDPFLCSLVYVSMFKLSDWCSVSRSHIICQWFYCQSFEMVSSRKEGRWPSSAREPSHLV